MKRLIPRRFARTRDFIDRHGTFIAFILVVLASAGAAFAISRQQDDIQQQQVNNAKAIKLALRALCDQRQSYVDQRKGTIDYLKMHPNGAPALGISRTQLLVQVHTLTLRIRAFSDLNCPPTIPPKSKS